MIQAIHQQFGAAIDSLEAIIRDYPEAEWHQGDQWFQPWYQAFHTLFWLDLYLSESSAEYVPPAPFTRGECESGVFPERPYSKAELLVWVAQCREALAYRLTTVGPDHPPRQCQLHWGTMEATELLLYNLRHVQHHVGQLNLRIRQAGGQPTPWVWRTDGLAGES